jgi:hypothetical protein
MAPHAVAIDQGARQSVDFPTLPEFLSGRTDAAVAVVVIGEAVAREGAVGMLAVRWDLSNTGMCGSIPGSCTSRFSISAVP